MRTVYHLLEDRKHELYTSEQYSNVMTWLYANIDQWELHHMKTEYSKDTIPTHKLVKMYCKRLKQ